MLRMQGAEVYRHAVRRMVDAIREALARAGKTVDDIDLFVAHQANVRIIEARPRRSSGCRSRRSSSTSIAWPTRRRPRSRSPCEQAERDGRLKPGATVALAAFGAGFVWGAGVVSWKERVHVCA